jgi:DNA-binding transcriptional ArsR family regulator
MEAEEKFISLAALICEPARAKMMWDLLDGRAYTAGELSNAADISATSTSNHLTKLLNADLVKVEIQGRHRYYSFSGPEVAYAVESLAGLAKNNLITGAKKVIEKTGVKYCRTCYDHLAGFVAVKIIEALESKGFIKKSETEYMVTKKGWKWFSIFNISEDGFKGNRRPLTRQCLDWSERRPHLAGQLGTVLLEKMFERKWFKKIQFSRELLVTSKCRRELYDLLGVDLT